MTLKDTEMAPVVDSAQVGHTMPDQPVEIEISVDLKRRRLVFNARNLKRLVVFELIISALAYAAKQGLL